MAKKTTRKNAGVLKSNKTEVAEITYLTSVSVHDEETLREVLTAVREAQEQVALVNKFIEIGRNHATTYMHSHATPVVQCEGHYWRLIQRMTRFFVGTDDDMPENAPKGAKSLKALCQGKKVGKKDTPLWNFITKREVDPKKLDEAVNKGYLKQKDVDKAYLESPQKPFVQPFTGEALDSEEA